MQKSAKHEAYATTGFRYENLERQLRDKIAEGRIAAGQRLPSIRELCAEFRLAKATVTHALRRLEAAGLVEARPRSGYYVRHHTPQAASVPPSRARTPEPIDASSHALMREVMQRGGAFDLCPTTEESTSSSEHHQPLNRAISAALRRRSHNTHRAYDAPRGLYALRRQLSHHYARRGLVIDPDALCITHGCQNALMLALMATCQAGDLVAVESPGFYGALQLLEALNLRVLEIPTSPETGLDVDALRQATEQWQIQACIVSPCFATPGGAVMQHDSKYALLALAENQDFALIEDDIYADTAFATPPDPLKALDSNGRVILCSSFSKSISPDLRVGWIAGGRWHEKITQLRLISQLGGSKFVQQGLADLMEHGGYQTLLRKRRQELEDQCSTLLRELSGWAREVCFSVPRGGLSVWLELPKDTDTLALYDIGKNHGIALVPGPLFSATQAYRNCLRISFARPWTEARLAALARLKSETGL